MEYKVLNINGAVLDRAHLEQYLEKLASDHVIINKSKKETYPIPRLKENFEFITYIYNLLNEHIKLKIPIHPAGEWILDNYYIIDETVKAICKELTLKKYVNFLGVSNSGYSGFARCYVLASEIINYTDGKVDAKNIKELLEAYQKKKSLSMDEIWNISTFMQIALIENIREICEKIYSSQMQKYRVENIIERLVENKNKEELKFKYIGDYKTQVKEIGEKYPFIEYMAYRLKSYGRRAYPFLNVLEEQVNKMGLDLTEVIEKEHFDIAVKKVSMGNSITSIKNLNRINMIDIFEKINGVEDILKQDPVNVYDKMDYKTKIYYRNRIKEISKKTKISEIYIAKTCLELAQNEYDGENKKQAHIGYYLIDQGENLLEEKLTGKKSNKKSYNQKAKIYIYGILILAILLSALFAIYLESQISNIVISIIVGILLIIPNQIFVQQIVQYVLGKIVKPKQIPKLDFQTGVPEEYTTFVVIPTIIKNKKRVEELMKKLEVYYMANKSKNIYFALLGDCSSGKNKEENFDKEVIESGKELAEILNKKYPEENFPKFHFLYRNREWNPKEECYLGWERKRGLLNQFNEYILGNSKNTFKENTIEKVKERIPKIKYIITLDADTDLVLNSGIELIGAMAHILNKPILNKKNDLVVSGHALMQPRVGINLSAIGKSTFTKIFAGSGGTDAYTNAISDTYQDNFDEGIFTGKGIYDLKVFSQVLNNEIPENTVLSHDLLEGNYLRCGLVSDISLMDGYPVGYNSFKSRQHRWIRGDWQIILWLKNHIKNRKGEIKENPLNTISKFKICDNLLRSSLEPIVILLLVILSIIDIIYNINIWPIVLLLLIAVIMPTIIDLVNKIIFKREEVKKQKTFTKTISGIKASVIRGILSIASLPDKAYMSINAIIKTLYRILVSKKHFLEWVTAEEAEKNAKKDLKSYYTNMLPNVIFGILGIVFSIIVKGTFAKIISIIFAFLWLIAPIILWKISKEIKVKPVVEKLSKEDKDYLYQIGKKTWQFFKDNLNSKCNYLPPDNYQEDRKPKIVYRTSSTNIGLGLLTVISSYNLGYENYENTIDLLEKMINTIMSMQKWNGHLYNWYNIENLQPLTPKYVSSVDSGNFVGYLYTLKSAIKEISNPEVNSNYNLQKENKKEKIEDLINKIDQLINNTDFSKLYDNENRLFSIGFNVEENSLTDSYYDLLASEARQTSLVAIAKKDIPPKHWYNLSRTLTVLDKYKGLISWSGTAFEYLMPNINIPKYEGSLLDESCKFMIMSQKKYAQKLNIPWGISEAAFNLKDLNNNYQYKAFGIPWLGLKRGLADEMVVSSYGSILAITDYPKEVVENIRKLEKQGMVSKYGFYESIDYTPNRLSRGEEYAQVKTYMAHHQGLILLSINNLFNNNILQKYFMENPEIKAVDILLQERMPEDMIITKEEKEKVEKIKYFDYENYVQREITKVNGKLKEINVIANNDYSIITDEKGNGYSKYGNNLIYRYKKTDDVDQGIVFYLKNIKTKRIWTSNYSNYLNKPDKYTMYFTPDMNKIVRQDGNIETTTKTFIVPNESIEIRRLELKNNGMEDETLEITSLLEPVLSSESQDYAHKAFNKLFLRYEFLNDTNTILVTRKKREESQQDIYLAVNLYTENNTIGDLEYEIDKDKFSGRGGGFCLPKAVENSIPFSKKIGLTIDPIVAMKRTINIKPEEKVALNLIIAVSENKEKVIEYINEYTNSEKIKRSMELSKAKNEAENRYLGVKGKDIILYQKILSLLLFNNPLKTVSYKNANYIPVTELWKYGISGDLPILLIKVFNQNDVENVDKILHAYEYFRVKNVSIDLVIINEEKNSYENYTKEAIMNCIYNNNLGYMQNIKGGIFVLDNLNNEEKDYLEERANLVINATKGSILRSIKDMEEEFWENQKEIGFEEIPQIIEENQVNRENLDYENLKYYNEYGGFSNDGKEYIIKVNKDERLPTVWSNVLANKNFGTIVTENMGGYTWYKNSRLNRLTAWANDPIEDVPSEIIYLEDMDTKKYWSVGLNPCPTEDNYYVKYGFGYANYLHTSDGITQELDVFVPKNDSIKVQKLHLENKEIKRKKLKIVYYVKPVLDEDEIKSNEYLKLEYNEKNNLIYLKNIAKQDSCIMYISSNEKINSYTGNKNFFVGKGNLRNPEGINKLKLDNENSLWNNGIIALEFRIELESLESKDIIINLGAGEKLLECQDIAYQYNSLNKVNMEFSNTKKYWSDLINTIKVSTPLESTNILLNGWLIYQTMSSRLLARSGYYQSGGAFGFRDQLQDTIALKYVDPNIMKNQILKHSEHQFLEGDVEHWWHEETKRGIRTRFSDDLLWLVFVTEDYINFTGDYSILDIKTHYLKGEILEEGVNEKYDEYLPSEISETIYEHCKRAIEKSLNFGENGLPKIGSGDWNDGLSNVGPKGKGESVWLGFFMYDVLKKFIPLCKLKGEEELANKYEQINEKLKRALNTNGWDGRWYKRAYMDTGEILGSLQNEECRIDSIAQSWATISGAGDNDKKYISIESLENHLVDRENGIIKLLDPPFEKSNLEPGYIKSYLPGTRENGGQYTHGAIWAIVAEAMLGFGDKAGEFFKMINPIEHTRTKESTQKYKGEPYVIAADIYGQRNLAGRSGWTWYTGSSSWMYEAGIKYILGLQIEKGVLRLKPCIPNDWKQYEIKYKYGDSMYNIKVINKNSKSTGIEKIYLNGNLVENNEITLNKSGGVYNIEVEI